MNKTEQYIVDQLKSKFNYWREYLKIYSEKTQEVEKDRKDFAEKIRKNPDDQSIQDKFEFLVYESNFMVNDLDKMVTDFLSIYKVVLGLGLEEHIPEEMSKTLSAMKDADRKATFAVKSGKLEERVKGGKQEHIEKLKQSPYYKEMLETLTSKLST